MRQQSENQLKKLRRTIKNSGGDIADKVSKDEQRLPNLYWMKNPADSKIDTYEDNYSVGNITKLKENKMIKHLKTFEQYDLYTSILDMIKNGMITLEDAKGIIDSQKFTDAAKAEIKEKLTKDTRKIKSKDVLECKYNFPFGVNQIPEFYIRQWLDLYYKWNEQNHTQPEYENLRDVIGDEKAISTVFAGAEKYAKERYRLLDGAEFMDSFFLKEDKNVDILRVGKGINLDNVKGIINKIEGKTVFVETEGGEIVEVPMAKIFKAYKKLDDRGFKYPDALNDK